MSRNVSHIPFSAQRIRALILIGRKICCLTLAFLLGLGAPTGAFAAVLSTVQFEWSYDTTLPGLMGYTIYQEGQPIVNINDPSALSSLQDVYLETGQENIFTITAYDNLGNESNPSAAIIVDVPAEDPSGNVPPVAVSELSTVSGPAPLLVDMSGSKSIDYDGTVVSYLWDFGDGSSSSSQNTFHTFDIPGTYTVALEVTDNEGASSTTQTTVTVTDPLAATNVDPTAVIYVTTNSGAAPLAVLFDGTDSTDSDGTIVDYSWDFGDGNSGNGAFVNYTYNTTGTFTARLTVTDDAGGTATAQTVITVSASSPVNIPPVAVITADPVSGLIPLTTSFSGAGSTDSDGTIVSYTWDFGDGSVASGLTASHQYVTSGTYTATLTVTDDFGDIGKAQVTISATATALPTTVVVSDDFTSDSSSSYTNISGTLSVASGAAHGSNWQTTIAYHNLSLGASDHWIEAEVAYSGLSDGGGLIARVDPASNTGYGVFFSAGKINLNRFSGTSMAWVANDSGTYAAGTYALRLVINGSTIQVYVDGVLKIQKTDSTYLTGQNAGIRIYRGNANADVTADNLRAGIGTPPPFPQENNPPVAQSTSITTSEDTSISGTFIVSDLDGDPLTASIVSNGTLGTAVINDPLAGTYTYTPNANISGTDTFTFKVNDGTDDSNTATVTVTVTAVNDLPLAQADSASTNEDSAVLIDVLANDSDIEGDALTITGVGQPAHGSAAISANQILYTPAANYSGPDSFPYQVSDSQGGTAGTTVTLNVIAVNDPPTAGDSALTTQENSAAAGTLTASDPEGDSLTFAIVANPSLGTATITDPATGAYTYTPNTNASGTDTFTFKANDGAADSNTATVTVTIEKVTVGEIVDDFSVDTAADYTSVSGSISVSGGLAHGQNWSRSMAFHNVPLDSSDHWVEAEVQYSGVSDSAGLLARVDSAKLTGYFVYFSGGRLNLNRFSGTSQSWVASDSGTYGAGSYLVRLITSGSTIQAYVNGVLKIQKTDSTYTAGQHVGLYFYRDSANTDVVADWFAAGTGTPPAAQTLNTAPIAADGTLALLEDTQASGILPASDPDGDPLTYTIINNGLLGTAVLTDPATGSFTYTPTANVNGTDSFTFQTNDGTDDSNIATITVNITPANDPPLAVADNAIINEDQAVAIGVLANDSDVDGDTLGITAVGTPLHGTASIAGTEIAYTPEPNYTGSDSFSYTITDGQGASATTDLSITINALNDPPVAVADNLTINEDQTVSVNVLANDTDIDGDPLALTAVGTPLHGTAAISGAEIVYTPDLNYIGTDSFSYTITDGQGANATADVTITVIALNDAPVATDMLLNATEDTPASGLLIANDPDNDALTYTIVSSGILGTAVLTDPATGTYTYTPGTNATGADSFTFTANDGTVDSNTATVTVSIAPANDAPTATPDNLIINEDQVVSVNALANDTDIDGDTLSIISVTTPAHGTAVLSGTNILYTPSSNYAGLDSFGYTIADPAGATADGTVSLTILGVNDAPVATDGTLTTSANIPASGTLIATDLENDPLTFSIVSNGGLGTATLTDPATGAYVYTPNTNASGTDTFTFMANDGTADSNVASVTVTIEAQVLTTAIADDFSANTSGNYTSISGSLTVLQGAAHGQNWRRTLAYHNTPLASSDHWVEAEVQYSGVSDSAGIAARIDPVNNTGYFISFAAGRLNLNRFSSTSQSWVASEGGPYDAGVYRVRMEMNGSTIQIYVDGVLKITKTDTTYTTGQNAGIYIYRDSANTDVTADNFAADLLTK